MRKLLLLAPILFFLNQGRASADDLDPQFPGDDRIKLLMYDEGDVYTIATRYGYQTNIVFDKNEEIETISVGDRSVWQIIPAGNRLFIRPMDEDVITNMTILTNKHSYQFDLKALAADKKEGNIYVAKFVYGNEKKKPPVAAKAVATDVAPVAAPADGSAKAPVMVVPSPFGYGPSVPAAQAEDKMDTKEAKAIKEEKVEKVESVEHAKEHAAETAPATVDKSSAQASAAQTQAANTPPSVTQPQINSPSPAELASMKNYNYTYAGADELAPLQVYDDGKVTYIKYHPMPQPLPEVFVVDPAGNERPATYAVHEDFVLVDAVAGELALKNKGNAIHIFNEVLNPK